MFATGKPFSNLSRISNSCMKASVTCFCFATSLLYTSLVFIQILLTFFISDYIMFNCGRCNFAVETEEVMTTHCLENHGVNHVNNYFKRGAKSIAKKVTLEETITKLARFSFI